MDLKSVVFSLFRNIFINDSNTYHGHGMTFRFDLCLLNVPCGDENKYEYFTHYIFLGHFFNIIYSYEFLYTIDGCIHEHTNFCNIIVTEINGF